MNFVLLIPIGLVLIFVIWVISTFNSFIVKKNRVKNAWSDVEVQLKRRYDLIPNLVETVKAYKEYEASVLENVTKARINAMTQTHLPEKAKAENELTLALKTLFAVAENYPNLKASENFKQLQDQLSAIENDIQSARRYYNAAVREFNNAIQVFPANILAGIFGFKPEEFFEAEEEEKEPVKVSF